MANTGERGSDLYWKKGVGAGPDPSLSTCIDSCPAAPTRALKQSVGPLNFPGPSIMFLRRNWVRFSCAGIANSSHCCPLHICGLIFFPVLRMDPLSITASVFTLLGACSGISKTLEAVRRIRDVPDALYSLSNEIEDLRLTLLDIHERREEFFKRDPTEFNSKDWRLFDRCHSLLEGTWTKVHEAQMLISSNLPAPGRNSISRSDGLMIPRESGRLNKLKIQIREAKQNIQSLCSQLDRRYSAQIQTQLSIISETGSGIQTRLLENNTLHVHNHQRIEGKVDKLLDNPVRHDDYQRLERKIDRLLEMQEALSSPVKQSLRINTHGRVRIDVMLTRVPYLRGALKITCQCRNRNQSSNYVPSFLGDLADLFLGYAAAPVFGKHRPGCQYKFQAEMVFVYSFPAWFLNHALVLRAKYDSRLRCSISVRPILPYYHVAWKLIESNDIEGLKCLFSSSQMPLEAQDENGNRFLDVSQLLDVDQKSRIHLTCNLGGFDAWEIRYGHLSSRNRGQLEGGEQWWTVTETILTL